MPVGSDSAICVVRDLAIVSRDRSGGRRRTNLPSIDPRREEVTAMALKNLFQKPTLTSLAKTCG